MGLAVVESVQAPCLPRRPPGGALGEADASRGAAGDRADQTRYVQILSTSQSAPFRKTRRRTSVWACFVSAGAADRSERAISRKT